MAGTSRITPIAWAVLLCLLQATAGFAATIFSDPGRPEDLIFDARFAAAVAVTRSTVAPTESVPARPHAALRVVTVGRCVIAATSAASAVGSGSGFIWTVSLCFDLPERPKRKRITGFSYGLTTLGIPQPQPAALVAPSSPAHRSPRGAPPAPVPLPAGFLGLGAALGLLGALKLRR
ncbi:MAG: hypothetical protein KDE00_05885 [Rhodobacteraceae bacterium]|nr:hypothetical protein [Paracoccaceae bacterium]